MFVLTFGKNGLRRLGAVAVCGVALAGAVFAVGSFFMEDDAAPAAANGETAQADPTAMKIEGTDDIQAFFKAFGLEVDLATATVDKVKIPKSWDESFSAFNTVVKESGLSLEKYKNKTVEKWVVLCPGRSTGPIRVFPSRFATSAQSSRPNSSSVFSARCGPCCSVEAAQSSSRRLRSSRKTATPMCISARMKPRGQKPIRTWETARHRKPTMNMTITRSSDQQMHYHWKTSRYILRIIWIMPILRKRRIPERRPWQKSRN